MGHVHPHVAGAVAGMQKIRTFYDCLNAAHRKTRLGSLPFHQIVGELDRVDDQGNTLEGYGAPLRSGGSTWTAWHNRSRRSFDPCAPLAVSGTRDRRDESAFTRSDKIMGIPWPAYQRPTAREIKEVREKAERDRPTPKIDSAPPWGAVTITINPGDSAPSGGGAPSGGDVDMTDSREKPAAAEAKKAGETAAKTSKDDKDTLTLILTQAPDTPAVPALRMSSRAAGCS